MRLPLLALFATVCAVVSLTPGAESAPTMAKAHLRPGAFKVYGGHLNAEQKRCLAFALKQWVMYDSAPAADGSDNANQTSDDVMSAGGEHKWDDANLHSRSSRSMSAGEKAAMGAAYGASSPFHAPGQPVGDPTAPDSDWFTNSEAEADLTIRVADVIPGDVPAGTLGWAHFATNKGQDTSGTTSYTKGRWEAGPAEIFMRTKPNERIWWYPEDDDGDGFITNKDHNTPLGMRDWYMIMKHELGHYFSFEHDGGAFFEREEPPPVYDGPTSLCSGAMSPANEDGACEAKGSEFALHAGRIYFASDRPGGFGGLDIWYASWDDSLEIWTGATNCGPGLNSSSNETDPFEGIDGGILYFASNRPGGLGGYDIYEAKREIDAVWDSVTALPAGINSASDDTGPFEIPDRFYFASNRSGGLGGSDLYLARLSGVSNRMWHPAENLGASVNTSADEIDPEISVQNGDSAAVLYFASTRTDFRTIGGFDIYRAEMNLGSWSPPANLGPPVNTEFNETDPSMSLQNLILYHACDRPDGHGGRDIFQERNLNPRPAVAFDHGAEGSAGQIVTVAFDVFNKGFAPLIAFPNVVSSEPWPVQFDPQPLQLLPGVPMPLDVQVMIPEGTNPGSQSMITLQIQAQGVRSLVASDHTWVKVMAPATAPEAGALAEVSFRALPNPSRGEVFFSLTAPAGGDARIELLDLGGRRIAVVTAERLQPGHHSLVWDGRTRSGAQVPSGVYFAQLTLGGRKLTRPVLIVR